MCGGGRALRLGRRPSPRHPARPDRAVRTACQRLHPPAPGRARGATWHLRWPGQRRCDSPPAGPGRHLGGAAAHPRFPRRPAPARPGAGQLLGLQHRGLPCARAPVWPGRPGQRVQGHGAQPAPRRAGSDPRRGLQPHRRRQRTGPHAEPAWHRQRRLLLAAARGPQPLPGLHRHRQQPRPAPARRPAPGDGQPALLGAADACGRLPLRPGHHAGARQPGL